MKLRTAALLALISTVAAEDVRHNQRADGGYDFFDYAGILVSYSTLNNKDSYDFYDRTGRLTGWSDARNAGQIDFYDASGTLYRTVQISADKSTVITSDLGQIYNFTVPNYQGGIYQFNVKAEITSFSSSIAFVVVRPDDLHP